MSKYFVVILVLIVVSGLIYSAQGIDETGDEGSLSRIIRSAEPDPDPHHRKGYYRGGGGGYYRGGYYNGGGYYGRRHGYYG